MLANLLGDLITRPSLWRLIAVMFAALTVALFFFNLRRAGETAAHAAVQLAQWERRYALVSGLVLAS